MDSTGFNNFFYKYIFNLNIKLKRIIKKSLGTHVYSPSPLGLRNKEPRRMCLGLFFFLFSFKDCPPLFLGK